MRREFEEISCVQWKDGIISKVWKVWPNDDYLRRLNLNDIENQGWEDCRSLEGYLWPCYEENYNLGGVRNA